MIYVYISCERNPCYIQYCEIHVVLFTLFQYAGYGTNNLHNCNIFLRYFCYIPLFCGISMAVTMLLFIYFFRLLLDISIFISCLL